MDARDILDGACDEPVFAVPTTMPCLPRQSCERTYSAECSTMFENPLGLNWLRAHTRPVGGGMTGHWPATPIARTKCLALFPRTQSLASPRLSNFGASC